MLWVALSFLLPVTPRFHSQNLAVVPSSTVSLFSSLNYLLVHAYCPLGCCRPVWVVEYRWLDCTEPDAMVDIIGVESETIKPKLQNF